MDMLDLERLAFGGPPDSPAVNALHAHTLPLDAAIDFNLNALQVRLEQPLADAGDLAADTTQILRLAAPRVMVAADRLLAAHRTLHSHGTNLNLWKSVNIAALRGPDKVLPLSLLTLPARDIIYS